MDAATCAVLAQVVPVLFLALLFEVRQAPRVRQSALGILLGFIGNLSVAIVAIVVEFLLIGGVQKGAVSSGAEFIWIACMAFFVIVVLRWVAGQTVAQILARETGAVGAEIGRQYIAVGVGMAHFLMEVRNAALAVLQSPAQVLADTLVLFAELVAKTLFSFVASATDSVKLLFGRPPNKR